MLVNRIIQVIPTDNYKIYLYFYNGEIKLFDAKELVKNKSFSIIKNIEIFKDTCTVLNGTLAWSLDKSYKLESCLMIDSVFLYKNCKNVDEPIELFPSLKFNSICPNCKRDFDGYYCEACKYCKEI